jgi:hypothetical protein
MKVLLHRRGYVNTPYSADSCEGGATEDETFRFSQTRGHEPIIVTSTFSTVDFRLSEELFLMKKIILLAAIALAGCVGGLSIPASTVVPTQVASLNGEAFSSFSPQQQEAISLLMNNDFKEHGSRWCKTPSGTVECTATTTLHFSSKDGLLYVAFLRQTTGPNPEKFQGSLPVMVTESGYAIFVANGWTYKLRANIAGKELMGTVYNGPKGGPSNFARL